jgi:hypothetical protein
MYVEYSSNNSGGNWWLSDQNWLDLEKAGWEVKWVKGDDRFLGALAMYATKQGTTLDEAIANWETVTGESSNSLGCECCGTPHSFTLYNDEGDYVDSYCPSYPSYGDSYWD